MLEEATSLEEIDRSIAIQAQSLSTVKLAWALTFSGKDHRDLTKVIDGVGGLNSSRCLFEPKTIPESCWHITISEKAALIERGERGLICGLSMMRHKLVHAPNAPDRFSVEALAPFGAYLATSLIDRDRGLVQFGLRDPLLRCQPFKKST
jgi:hypothetical protein